MKVSMDCYTYQRRFREREWTVWDYLAHCERLRLDGAHLDRRHIGAEPDAAKHEYAKVRRFCDERGWEVVVAGGNRWFASQERESCLAEVTRDLRAAKLLGARIVRVFLGGDVPRRRAAIEWSIRNLREALVLAEEHDCVLAVEIPHKAIDFPADGLEILERLDSRHLGVTLDSGNLYANVDAHLPPVRAVELLAPHIVATHIRDYEYDPKADKYHCVPCGEGLVDLPAIAGILKAHGYQGTLALEFLQLRSGEEGEERDRAIAASIEYLRSL